MISTLTPERRTGFFFFCQFIAGGTANAYAGIWLSHQNLSAQEIGLVNSLPVAVLLAINIFVGRIADRASDWRQVIVWGAAISAVSAMGLFWANSFPAILLVFVLTATAQSMIVPVADAAALHLMARHSGGLGLMRSLSTLGYLFGLLVSGLLIGKLGSWLYVPLFAGLSFARLWGAITLPRFKSVIDVQSERRDHRFMDFLQPWLVLPLAGWSIVYGTHFVLNGFQSLLWSQQGYSTTAISLLIAVGALSEAVAFFLFQRVANRLRARWLILLSSAVTVLRWWAMSFDPPTTALIALQLLHGITFALGFLACVTFIGRNSPINVAAEAQSFFLVLQQIAAIAVITVFSWLAEGTPAEAFSGNAIMALAGTLVVVGGLWLSRTHKAVSHSV